MCCGYCSSGTLDELVGCLWFEGFLECGLWVLAVVACLVICYWLQWLCLAVFRGCYNVSF